MKVLYCFMLLLGLASADENSLNCRVNALDILVDIDGGASCELKYSSKDRPEKWDLSECVSSIICMSEDLIKVCRTETDCELALVHFESIVFIFNKDITTVTGIRKKNKKEKNRTTPDFEFDDILPFYVQEIEY